MQASVNQSMLNSWLVWRDRSNIFEFQKLFWWSLLAYCRGWPAHRVCQIVDADIFYRQWSGPSGAVCSECALILVIWFGCTFCQYLPWLHRRVARLSLKTPQEFFNSFTFGKHNCSFDDRQTWMAGVLSCCVTAELWLWWWPRTPSSCWSATQTCIVHSIQIYYV